MGGRVRALGAWAIGGFCAWEVVALTTGHLPTWSSIAHRIRRRPAGAALILAGLGWLTHHLLLEEDNPKGHP